MPTDGRASKLDDRPSFGRYQAIARIARGGMGTVYLCRLAGEGGFHRLFAVKAIHEHLAEDPEFVRMLKQEAQIASRAHHPNIVSILDVGWDSCGYYLAMDYVEGCTLGDLLKFHHSSRPARLLIPIILDAMNGLETAHCLRDDEGKELGLVHRDVSPQNLLVGVDGICRLIDFGIAKAAANHLQHTRPGVSKGKPAYMSPEQVSGAELDRRSDIFSLGIVLWNALTGKRLFDGTSPHSTMYNVLKRRIPPPSKVGLHPPECFDAVCLKALNRDPRRRYKSVVEMAIDLRERAMDAGVLAPTSEVASWVSDTFGADFEERRQAIRAFTAQTESSPTQQIKSLPALTLAVNEIQPTMESTSVQASILTWHDLSAPGEANDDLIADEEIQAFTAMHDAPERGRKRRKIIVLVGALAIAGIVGGLVATRVFSERGSVSGSETIGPGPSGNNKKSAKGALESELRARTPVGDLTNTVNSSKDDVSASPKSIEDSTEETGEVDLNGRTKGAEEQSPSVATKRTTRNVRQRILLRKKDRAKKSAQNKGSARGQGVTSSPESEPEPKIERSERLSEVESNPYLIVE